MNRQRSLIFVFAAIGIISILLPWFSANTFGFAVHVNGFHSWGILTFACFVAAAVIALAGKKTVALNHPTWLMALLCGALALLSVIMFIAASGTDNAPDFVSPQFGMGVWIAFIAAAGIIVFAWIYRNGAKNS